MISRGTGAPGMGHARRLLAVLAAFATFTAMPSKAAEDAKNPLANALSGALQNLLTGGSKSRVRTTLDKENLRSFNEHKATRKGFAGFRNYGTWPACTYSFMAKKADGTLLTDVVTLSSRAVKDRFLVSSRHSKGLSTALIGIDGTAYDYNWVDNEDGTRFTRENFNAVIAKKFQKEHSRDPVRARNLVVIDPMSIGFPVFQNASRMPGEVAARIVKTDGSTYGEYVYAGLLNYKGYPALKLEVMLNRDGQVAGGPILIGYALIRQDNLMPLRFVWQTDRMEISELIRCV